MLAAESVFALALATLVPAWAACSLGALGLVMVVRRTRYIWADPPRARWKVLLVDIPIFWHLGASLSALVTLPIGLLVALGLHLSGVQGSWFSLAAPAAYALGAFLSLFAISVGRHRVVTREVELTIETLPQAFDGYRVVQLSDLHIGSFDGVRRGLEWARRANALRADLIVVTGDLVTSGVHYYEHVAEALGTLRAPDGVFAILGNHDQSEPAKLVSELTKRGVRTLENTWVTLTREGAELVLAGLGDRFSGRDDLEKTLAQRPAGVTTLLLAHYPNYFPAAAAQGVELVLAGHTHGGQIGLPFLGHRFNLASLTGQAVRGVHRLGKSLLYVSAGLGTSGPPLRLGVSAEIAVLTLKAGSQRRGADVPGAK